MKLPFGPGRTVAVFAGLLAGASLASAQSAAAPSAEKSPAEAPDENILTLDVFTVSGTRSDGYRATNAITATGIGAKIADTPLAISTVTKDLIQDTAGLEMREALNFVPGVLTNPRSESSVVIRGFGGLISYRNGQYRRQLMTTWNIDRVEVIKGPASIFFGAVRPGGIVNNVTIKPTFSGDSTEAKVTVGSDGFLSGEIFENKVLGDELAVRVGVGGLTVDGSRPYEYRDENYVGASAIWKPAPRHQLTVDLEAINRDTFYLSSYPVRALANSKVLGSAAAIQAQAGINRQSVTADSANTTALQALGFVTGASNYGKTNFYPLYDMFAPFAYDSVVGSDAKQIQRSQTVDLEYLFQINNRLVWQTVLNYGFDNTSGLQPSDGEVRPYADGTIRFRTENFINVRDSYNVHNKLTWRFEVAGSKHTLQAAQEYQNVLFTRPGYLNASNQYNDSPGNTGSSAINPYVTGFRPGTTTPVSLNAVFNASGQTFNIVRKRTEVNKGYYIVDQATFLNDRLFVLAGARYNQFSGKIRYNKPISNSSLSAANGGLIDRDVIASKGGLTPQYGALFKIVPQLSAFATYSESIEPVFQLDADGVASQPVESQALDFGLKTELADGRFTATAAYYDNDRQNIAYRDTTRELATGRSPYYIFGNEETSKGLEFDANWSVTNNYQVIFGWSHVLDAKTVKSNVATNVGRRFGYIPDNTYVIWNRYGFDSGPLAGLVLGLGFRHNDAAPMSADVNNAVVVPGFGVVDAMVSYKFKWLGRDLKAQLNVKNLEDKLYREGSDGYFGAARSFMLSLKTTF